MQASMAAWRDYHGRGSEQARMLGVLAAHDGLLGSALGKQEAEQGREKERREREPGLTAIFVKILCGALKTFNTKVVENLKAYNFYFRKKFIRAMV